MVGRPKPPVEAPKPPEQKKEGEAPKSAPPPASQAIANAAAAAAAQIGGPVEGPKGEISPAPMAQPKVFHVAPDKDKSALVFSVEGASETPEVIITQEIIKIGKDPKSHICIEDGGISRMHAVIEWMDGAATLIDLGNEPQTRVNDHEINKAKLSIGDTITLGSVTLKLKRMGTEPAPAEEASPPASIRPAPRNATPPPAAAEGEFLPSEIVQADSEENPFETSTPDSAFDPARDVQSLPPSIPPAVAQAPQSDEQRPVAAVAFPVASAQAAQPPVAARTISDMPPPMPVPAPQSKSKKGAVGVWLSGHKTEFIATAAVIAAAIFGLYQTYQWGYRSGKASVPKPTPCVCDDKPAPAPAPQQDDLEIVPANEATDAGVAPEPAVETKKPKPTAVKPTTPAPTETAKPAGKKTPCTGDEVTTVKNTMNSALDKAVSKIREKLSCVGFMASATAVYNPEGKYVTWNGDALCNDGTNSLNLRTAKDREGKAIVNLNLGEIQVSTTNPAGCTVTVSKSK